MSSARVMCKLCRFLHPSSGSQSFYGSGGHSDSCGRDENVQSVLQSICTTLCDVQSQLSAIKQQNDDKDLALKKIVNEVCNSCSCDFKSNCYVDRRSQGKKE